MRRLFGEIAISELPSEIRRLWYTRDDEPETEEFNHLPGWMEPPEPHQRRDLELVATYLLTTLTEREAELLIRRYWYEFTLEECGQQMSVTRERVRQIEMKALRKLRHPGRAWLFTLAVDLPREQLSKWERYWPNQASSKEKFFEWIRESTDKKVGIGVAHV